MRFISTSQPGGICCPSPTTLYSEDGLNTGLKVAVVNGAGVVAESGGCDTGGGVVGRVGGERAVGD